MNSQSAGLESSPDFYQSIIDCIADPIMVIDNDYRVILMNHAARKFAADDKLPSQPLYCYQVSHKLSVPCNNRAQPCPLENVRKHQQPISVIHEHGSATGEKRIMELQAAPLCSADGTFVGIIESMHDITERDRTERALRQSTRRLRALTSQLAELSEIERKWLSQELHDQIGQRLTALGINLNIIRTEITPGASASLLSRTDDCLSLLEQITRRIRDVMADLRPPVLDDYGLVVALGWYARRYKQRTNIDISVMGQELCPRLVSRKENALFRIAQEALTNVAKHARATTVEVTVEETDGVVRLTVADDGIGFHPIPFVDKNSKQGWGIITMIERAEAEGGRCCIKSQLDKGTRVIVEMNR